MQQTADNHIFEFVASWIGFADETNFETRLYRCLAVFRPLSFDRYKTLMSNLALPLYVIFIVAQLTLMCFAINKRWYFKEKAEDNEESKTSTSFEVTQNKRRKDVNNGRHKMRELDEKFSEKTVSDEAMTSGNEPIVYYYTGNMS